MPSVLSLPSRSGVGAGPWACAGQFGSLGQRHLVISFCVRRLGVRAGLSARLSQVVPPRLWTRCFHRPLCLSEGRSQGSPSSQFGGVSDHCNPFVPPRLWCCIGTTGPPCFRDASFPLLAGVLSRIPRPCFQLRITKGTGLGFSVRTGMRAYAALCRLASRNLCATADSSPYPTAV